MGRVYHLPLDTVDCHFGGQAIIKPRPLCKSGQLLTKLALNQNNKKDT